MPRLYVEILVTLNPNIRHMKRVVAALMVQDGKILICQRTPHQTMPLKWEFPGGKIEPGEGLEEALRRELDEELGIRATIGNKVTTVHHNYGNFSSSGTAVELHFFLVEKFDGEIENRIFNDVRWVNLADLLGYDFLEADVALVKDLASGKVSLTGPRTHTPRS